MKLIGPHLAAAGNTQATAADSSQVKVEEAAQLLAAALRLNRAVTPGLEANLLKGRPRSAAVEAEEGSFVGSYMAWDICRGY
jgi:hypothetical protein